MSSYRYDCLLCPIKSVEIHHKALAKVFPNITLDLKLIIPITDIKRGNIADDIKINPSSEAETFPVQVIIMNHPMLN